MRTIHTLIAGWLLAMFCLATSHAQASTGVDVNLDSADNGLLVISYHDIRDDVVRHGDPDPYAVSTQNFAAHLDCCPPMGITRYRSRS